MTLYIALIKNNKCYFDDIEKYANPLLYKLDSNEQRTVIKSKLNEYIWDVISPYITFINVTTDTICDILCEHISKSSDANIRDLFFHTEGSYSTPKCFLEIVYGQDIKNTTNNITQSINNLACLFSLKHTVIENDAILIANKFDSTQYHCVSLISICKNDILRIIRRRFMHTAIFIRNNQIEKYYYQDPQYLVFTLFNLSKDDNINTCYFTHMKYNLVYLFKQSDDNNKINEIATRIYGKYIFRGDILILHELENNIYSNLSISEIKNIDAVSYGHTKNRLLTNEEIDIKTINTDRKSVV